MLKEICGKQSLNTMRNVFCFSPFIRIFTSRCVTAVPRAWLLSVFPYPLLCADAVQLAFVHEMVGRFNIVGDDASRFVCTLLLVRVCVVSLFLSVKKVKRKHRLVWLCVMHCAPWMR